MRRIWQSKTIISQHKYAIDSAMLGDDAVLAWSNLGLWRNTSNYVQACQALAMHLAQSVNLSAQDKLLDLGCGQGASLQLWQQEFHVASFDAVELQAACVEKIQKQTILGLNRVHLGSFLALQPQQFQHQFDVVLSIDALYHHSLGDFLAVISPLLAENGRIAFHYLRLNAAWHSASAWQKLRYRYLLKAADVQMDSLKDQHGLETELKQHSFRHIQIEDLTQSVCAGFAAYIQNLPKTQLYGVDGFKIKMTAKLCQQLAQDGLVDYVQINAQQSPF